MKLSAEARLRLAGRMAFVAGVGAIATANAEDAPKAQQLQGVQVTGSRLKQANLTNSSSLTVVNDEELRLQGTVNVENLLNSLPQVFADFGSTASNGSTGTATVDLYGLGAIRTLVLIDGKRLAPGDPTAKVSSGSSPDLNFIPAALVERVEVLSEGASAVYGSDAVSGVVNFIMKKDFEGFQIDAQASRTDHSDGSTYDTTLLFGSNFAGGKGNVTLFAGYTNLQAVTQDKRGYSACSLTTPSSGDRHRCQGSANIVEGYIYSYANAAGVMDDPAGTRTFVPYDGRTFNFAPYNFTQRPDHRYNLGGFAHYDLNSHHQLYGSFMFLDDHTIAQLAPTPIGFRTLNVNCNNPLFSAQEQGAIGCTAADIAAGNQVTFAYGKRTVEIGPRQDDLRHTDFRIVVGAKGDLSEAWSYELSGQHTEVIYQDTSRNDVNLAKLQDGLLVDPTTGACISGNASCIPIDIFQLHGITPAQADSIRANGLQHGSNIEQVVIGSLAGDLGKYGIRLPTAKDGIGIVGGLEYRTEALNLDVDGATADAQLPGFGQTSPNKGQYQVNEAFGELRVPLVNDAPFVKLLQVDAAYRWSNYSLANDVHAYNGAIKWAPIDDFTIRASYSRAVRAPTVIELFAAHNSNLFGGNDPCAMSRTGTPSQFTAAQCANTGLTGALAANYNTVGLNCPSGQCNAELGGNLNLKPEQSITRQLGIVFTPTFIKGFTATVDYYDLTLRHAIGVVPGNASLSGCALTGDPFFCNSIHRNPTSGRLFGDPTNTVDEFNLNTGLLRIKGIDVGIDYRRKLSDFGLGNNGTLAFNFLGSWIEDTLLENFPGDGVYSCKALYGPTCSTSTAPAPEWRHKARLTWISPLGARGLTVSAQTRYIGQLFLDYNKNVRQLSPQAYDTIDRKFGPKQYLDLSGSYVLPTKERNITLRFGISNVAGQNPPVASSNAPNSIIVPPFGNGNTYPQLYDALGRVMFVGATANF